MRPGRTRQSCRKFATPAVLNRRCRKVVVGAFLRCFARHRGERGGRGVHVLLNFVFGVMSQGALLVVQHYSTVFVFFCHGCETYSMRGWLAPTRLGAQHWNPLPWSWSLTREAMEARSKLVF